MNVKNCRYILNIVSKAAKTSTRPKITLNKLEAMGATNPFSGEIVINKNLNSKLLRPIFLKKYLRHELKHAEQFQIMARYYAGKEGNIEKGIEKFQQMLSKKIFNDPSIGYINNQYYSRVIKNDGIIDKYHSLYAKAEEYVKAFNEYPNMAKAMERKSNQSFFEYLKTLYKTKKEYSNNLLEQEAVKASRIFKT